MDRYSTQERMRRLIQGESLDRVPLVTNATVFSGVFARLSAQQFFGDMRRMYEAQEQTRALFGCHSGPTFCYTNWIPESLGGKNIFETTAQGLSIPQMKPLISCRKDLENFSLPATLKAIPTLRMRKEFIEISKEKGARKTAMICGSVVEIAAQITDIQLLLCWMLESPELVYHLCDLLTEYLLRLVDADIAQYGAENCIALFFYPLESRDIMSPKLLDQFSWPYAAAMHQALRQRGIQTFQEHLCGDQNANIPFFHSLGLPARTMFTLDEKNDLKKAAAGLGDDYIIGGNVSSGLLACGTPEDVMRCCRDTLEIGKKIKGGFVLMPSCDLPPYTPPLNLYAMHRAACTYGTYEGGKA